MSDFPAKTLVLPDDLAQRIVFEDNHLLVVAKRCGELSQGDKTGDPSLVDYYRELLRVREAKPGQAFLGLVHRLDRPTSGLLVLAKTSKGLARLNAQFQTREVRKWYWALVDRAPPSPAGQLQHWLDRTEKSNKSHAFDTPGKNLVEARLAYRTLAQGERYWLLEIELLTGRHHQIRAQLAAIGLHIRGDLKYGAQRSRPDGGIALHAARLRLNHPVGSRALDLVCDPRLVQNDAAWSLLEGLELPRPPEYID